MLAHVLLHSTNGLTPELCRPNKNNELVIKIFITNFGMFAILLKCIWSTYNKTDTTLTAHNNNPKMPKNMFYLPIKYKLMVS